VAASPDFCPRLPVIGIGNRFGRATAKPDHRPGIPSPECDPELAVGRVRCPWPRSDDGSRPQRHDAVATASLVSPRLADGCLSPKVHKPSRSKPAASAALSLLNHIGQPFRPEALVRRRRSGRLQRAERSSPQVAARRRSAAIALETTAPAEQVIGWPRKQKCARAQTELRLIVQRATGFPLLHQASRSQDVTNWARRPVSAASVARRHRGAPRRQSRNALHARLSDPRRPRRAFMVFHGAHRHLLALRSLRVCRTRPLPASSTALRKRPHQSPSPVRNSPRRVRPAGARDRRCLADATAGRARARGRWASLNGAEESKARPW